MSLLLETPNVGPGNWILLGILLLVLVASPFFMRAKNKKEMQNAQNMMDSLKKGDKVLTSAGVIGKIVEIDNKDGYKTVVIETGSAKHKGYLCVDIASIYLNLSAPVEQPTENKKEVVEEKQENIVETTEVIEESKPEVVEENTQEVKEEKPKKAKKSKKQ